MVTREPTRDEDDVAVPPRDALAAVGQRLDLQGEKLAPIGSLLRCARRLISHRDLSLQPVVAWDLGEYRREAEAFLEEIDREYYLHLAGHKPELAVEEIYDRHASLFAREAVDRIGEEAQMRARASATRADGGEAELRLRYLHQFAVDGHLGAITRELEAGWPSSKRPSRFQSVARRCRTARLR